MSKVQMLLLLKKQRLTAAAEEIFALFEQTIAELEEELSLSKEENERLQKLLDAVLQPQLRIHRAGSQWRWMRMGVMGSEDGGDVVRGWGCYGQRMGVMWSEDGGVMRMVVMWSEDGVLWSEDGGVVVRGWGGCGQRMGVMWSEDGGDVGDVVRGRGCCGQRMNGGDVVRGRG
ncbi:hypothetical protein NQZ68_014527 [Dissostichus eleginoides]|nr:hypothetical protein NQZ68_014527 [Dissostichus eleginoides]